MSDRKELRVAIACSSRFNRTSDFFHALARELQEKGHKVWMVRWNISTQKSLPVPSGVIDLVFPSRWPSRLRDLKYFYHLLRRKSINCVLATNEALTTCTLAAVFAQVPVRCGWVHATLKVLILENRGLTCRLTYDLLKYRLIYALLTHVVAVSRACRDDLVKRWRVSQEKIVVLPNAVGRPPTEFQRMERERGKIVCAARLAVTKGHKVLLTAMKEVVRKFPGVRCHFVGDGPERDVLETTVRELGLSKHVFFHGAVDHERVLKEMATAAVMVLPSLDEAFGYAVTEAMSVGTPVVASRVGGIVEIVRDGMDGFLVNPGDPTELADALIRVLGDDDLREKLGRNARLRFEEEFELGRRANSFVRWLERAISMTLV